MVQSRAVEGWSDRHSGTPLGGQDLREGASPTDRLIGLHAELAAMAVRHRELCAASNPDMKELAAIRWRIADLGRRRMDLLTVTIFPLLEQRCVGSDGVTLRALRDATAMYRTAISVYVSRWSTSAISREWATYRTESALFHARVRERLAMERAILVPLLGKV